MPSGSRFLALKTLAGRLVPLGTAIAIAACKGDATPTSVPAPPPIDAAAPPDGITTVSGFDPASGMHLDEDTPPAPRTGGASAHSHRTLEILLRSQPTGATVAVDGVIVGQTPTYWEGEFTGHEREFTFVMPGYAMARYRFVPTSNGVVHGRLTKLASDLRPGVPVIPRPEDLGLSPAPPDPPSPRSRLQPRPTAADAMPAPAPAEDPVSAPGGSSDAAPSPTTGAAPSIPRPPASDATISQDAPLAPR